MQAMRSITKQSWRFIIVGFVIVLQAALPRAVYGQNSEFDQEMAAAPDNGPNPGNYEVNAVWILQGQSRPAAPAQSCLNQEDLNNPERVFNVSTVREARNCSIKNLVYAGGKISYEVDCGQLLTHVEGIYTETGYSVIRTGPCDLTEKPATVPTNQT